MFHPLPCRAGQALTILNKHFSFSYFACQKTSERESIAQREVNQSDQYDHVIISSLFSPHVPHNAKIKIIMSILLYCFETCMVSYINGEMQVKSNRKQDPEAKDANGEWRRLHNEELHCLYHSPSIFRVMKFIGLR